MSQNTENTELKLNHQAAEDHDNKTSISPASSNEDKMKYDEKDLDNIEYDMILSQMEKLALQLSKLSYNNTSNNNNHESNPSEQIAKIRDILLSSDPASVDVTNFSLKWRHITNAIQQELYLKLAI